MAAWWNPFSWFEKSNVNNQQNQNNLNTKIKDVSSFVPSTPNNLYLPPKKQVEDLRNQIIDLKSKLQSEPKLQSAPSKELISTTTISINDIIIRNITVATEVFGRMTSNSVWPTNVTFEWDTNKPTNSKVFRNGSEKSIQSISGFSTHHIAKTTLLLSGGGDSLFLYIIEAIAGDQDQKLSITCHLVAFGKSKCN